MTGTLIRPGKRFYGPYLIAALWLIYFTNLGFGYYGGSVINTFMVKSLGMDRKTLGLGFTVFLFMQGGIMGPVIAAVINRKGVRFALAAGSLCIFAAAVLMAAAVRERASFFAVYGLLMGFGVGLGGILPVQTAATLWFDRARSRAIAVMLTAGGVGGFAAAPLAGHAMTAAGGSWRAGWVLVAAFAALSFALSVLFVKNRPSDVGQVPDGGGKPWGGEVSPPAERRRAFRTARTWTVREALKTGSLWLVFMGAVGYLVPYSFCMGHGVIHLMDRGFDGGTAAFSVGLLTLCSIVGRLVGGVLGDRYEPRFVWCASCVLMIAGVVSLMGARSPVHVHLYSVLMGLGFGSSFIQMPTIIANYFGPGAFASIMGTMSPIYAIFSAMAPFAGGVIYDTAGSYTAAFVGVIALGSIGTVALLAAAPPGESAV